MIPIINFTAKDLGETYEYKERFVWHCPFSGRNTLQDNWEHDVDELVYYEINHVGEPSKMSEEIEALYEEFLDQEDNFDDFIDYISQHLDPEKFCCFIIQHPDDDPGDFATLIYQL